jgi:hypothetical protein
MKPKRIQRRRAKGWKMPPNTVYVGRPTRWGNPYFPGSGRSRGFFDKDMTPTEYEAHDRRVQVQWFRELMAEANMRSDFLAPLRGKNLACWCKLGDPCHADVLLELANKMERTEGIEPSSLAWKATALPLS